MLLSGRVTANGVFGSPSAASLYGATSDEPDRYRFIGAGVEHAFSSATTSLDVGDSRAELLNGYEYRSQRAHLEVRSHGTEAGAVQVQPFVALSWRDAEGRYPDLNMSQTRTRAAAIGAIARHSGTRTFAQVRTDYSRGFDALGARVFSRNGAVSDVEFAKASLDATFIHSLAMRWRVRVDAQGQWSDADLPAGERFTFGGASFGRAFDPAELIGDSGAALSLQLEHLQTWRHVWLRQSSLYLQGDYGYARDNEFGSDEAASLTAGLKATFATMLAKLELSAPLMRAHDESLGNVRAFAQIQYVF
jgi:hemolysin activation/secretion protein